MKKFIGIGLMLVLYSAGAFAQGAIVDKTTLKINLRTHRGQAEWRWTPKISFNLGGNISEAAKISVEFTDPAGKSIFKLDCAHYESGEIQWRTVSDCGNDLEADVAVTNTGVHGFQIKSANAVLYAGKFPVGKYLFNPAKNPAMNKNFYYYVDYDWRLPVAFVGSVKDEYTPRQLTAWLWIKGETSSPEAKAYLLYKGKTVSETSFGMDQEYIATENNALDFSRLRFRFNAMLEKPAGDSYDGWWKVYENPGEYEIRVERKGVPARTFKFTIGKDGKPVPSGIGKEIAEGHDLTVVPVKIEDTSDGAINQIILKSGWWGNPISGLPSQ
jgi:hypothetical protein